MKDIDLYRKSPQQNRSTYTVNLIFEATAQILQQERQANFTTNAIAELAGVSIGTLYQYFPNKNAILIAMAKVELDKITQKIIQQLNTEQPKLAKVLISELVNGFGGRQKMRQILLNELINNGLMDELNQPLEQVIQAILQQQQHQATSAILLSPMQLYIMTRAIIGVLRSAVLEQSPYLYHDEFVKELADLLDYFLAK